MHGDIRLRGGTNSSAGRVEICNNATWGTVCDDNWDIENTRVACRELGLSTTGSYKHCMNLHEAPYKNCLTTQWLLPPFLVSPLVIVRSGWMKCSVLEMRVDSLTVLPTLWETTTAFTMKMLEFIVLLLVCRALSLR